MDYLLFLLNSINYEKNNEDVKKEQNLSLYIIEPFNQRNEMYM